MVDNNSVDDSVRMVQEKFPEVRLLANTHNPGFAIANNQAIRESRGEYVLLLNPDTLVQEDTFVKCIAFMDAHPDAGALGVKLIDGSGKFLPESRRGFPSPWVAFCKTFGGAGIATKEVKNLLQSKKGRAHCESRTAEAGARADHCRQSNPTLIR